jgi:type IV secretion system protein VirB6
MIKNYFTLIIALLILAGCSGENCIEADDFGHSTITVSAKYSKAELGGQVGANQVAPWRDSGYRVNGRPLTIVVRGWDYGIDKNNISELSAWCAWFGGSVQNSEILAPFCERLQDCKFVDDTMCTNTPDARITNAPCLFRKGVGLYALIGAKGTDPNQSFGSMRSPQGISMHLGETDRNLGVSDSQYSLYDLDKNGNSRAAGGIIYKFASESESRQYNDSKLYFKILDKFYDDNSGQYKVIVKSGIDRANPDPISYVTMLVKQFLFGVQSNGEELLPGLAASNADGVFDGNNGGIIKNIYMGIVNNPGYRTAVSALLTLYIMWTGMTYLAGNVQLTHTELIVRVGKIAVVSALLSSEYSWSFFNDYLFVYFIGGVEQILQIIMEAGATGPGSPGILAMMIAPQTLAKLFSLLFSSWLGWLYILLFGGALYFIVMIFFNAAVIYLSALIAVGMIIVMGPIFVCFLLFGITRSLFDNWLKQLISYAIQPIILFTGLLFISMTLKQEIYGALGFKVCKQSFFKMQNSTTPQILTQATQEALGFNPGDSLFYWWFPSPLTGEGFQKTTVKMPIPIDHEAGEYEVGDIRNGFCEAYGCIGDRYPDLPFLDPAKDQWRIVQFFNGQFVQLNGLLLIFAVLYLLHKFNAMAVSTARSIGGTSGSYTNIQNVGDMVHAQTFAKSNAFMASIPGKLKQGATDFVDRQIGKRALKSSGVDLSGKSSSQIAAMEKQYGRAIRNEYSASALIDKARIRTLKSEALSRFANSSILAEVQKNTGLKRSDVDKNANSKYKKALSETLENIGISKKDSKKLAQKMSKKRYAAMNKEFAKAKYGKEYDQLSDKEKIDINKIHKDPNLRKLANENAKARRFRNAYANAYAAMSDRGIGVFAKHSRVIRSIEEIRYEAKEHKKLSEAKKMQRGEEIYSAVEGAKKGVFTALGGNPQSSSIGRTFAGGAYHDVNSGDVRKMTYAETLAENKQGFKRNKLEKTIDQYNRKYGESVISPEFLARAERSNDPKLQSFRNLEKKQVQAVVQDALKSGSDPVLMGRTYMQNYAKDSEMRHMIDRASVVEREIFATDEFISREAEYQTSYDLAKEEIGRTYKELADRGYDINKISKEELPNVFSKYLESESKMSSPKERAERVEKLQASIQNFSSSQQVLNQIDQRKVEVAKEIDKHVSDINKYRTNAGMEQYKIKRSSDVGIRKLRTIEDLKKGKV